MIRSKGCIVVGLAVQQLRIQRPALPHPRAGRGTARQTRKAGSFIASRSRTGQVRFETCSACEGSCGCRAKLPRTCQPFVVQDGKIFDEAPWQEICPFPCSVAVVTVQQWPVTSSSVVCELSMGPAPFLSPSSFDLTGCAARGSVEIFFSRNGVQEASVRDADVINKLTSSAESSFLYPTVQVHVD